MPTCCLSIMYTFMSQTSTWANRDRGIELVLEKTSAGFWHSLVKDHQKSLFKNQMKTDWQLFMDEDDLDEERKRKCKRLVVCCLFICHCADYWSIGDFMHIRTQLEPGQATAACLISHP